MFWFRQSPSKGFSTFFKSLALKKLQTPDVYLLQAVFGKTRPSHTPLNPSPDRIPQLTAAIDLVNEISKQLTDRKNDAVAEISNTFEELEKAMHLRKNALIAEVENICSTKQKVSPALL